MGNNPIYIWIRCLSSSFCTAFPGSGAGRLHLHLLERGEVRWGFRWGFRGFLVPIRRAMVVSGSLSRWVGR